MSTAKLHSQSLIVPVRSTDQLHLTRLYQNIKQLGSPVLMLHSVAQSSDTFLRSGGLAEFLARQGFDVYVADLRGRGRSWPALNHRAKWGVHEIITQDIPALAKKIRSIRGDSPQVWVSHGWGGVLLCAAYARFGKELAPIKRMVHFATRRRMLGENWWQRWLLQGYWRYCSRPITWLKGYMPARWLKLGAVDESAGMLRDYLRWMGSEQWLDGVDNFDYRQGLQVNGLPPSVYIASLADRSYGSVEEVRCFVDELVPHDRRFLILGREVGSQHNYSHFSMIQHSDCARDHFPLIANWLQES